MNSKIALMLFFLNSVVHAGEVATFDAIYDEKVVTPLNVSLAAAGIAVTAVTGGLALIPLSVSTASEVGYSVATNEYYKYELSKTIEDSMKVGSLPTPKAENGSDSYNDTIEIMEEYDPFVLSYSVPREYLSNHLSHNESEQVHEQSLLALLSMNDQNYTRSIKWSQASIEGARKLDKRRTLPAFTYAVSALVLEKESIIDIYTNSLYYAYYAENKNTMTPLMSAIFGKQLLKKVGKNSATFDDILMFNSIASYNFIVKQKEQQVKKEKLTKNEKTLWATISGVSGTLAYSTAARLAQPQLENLKKRGQQSSIIIASLTLGLSYEAEETMDIMDTIDVEHSDMEKFNDDLKVALQLYKDSIMTSKTIVDNIDVTVLNENNLNIFQGLYIQITDKAFKLHSLDDKVNSFIKEHEKSWFERLF